MSEWTAKIAWMTSDGKTVYNLRLGGELVLKGGLGTNFHSKETLLQAGYSPGMGIFRIQSRGPGMTALGAEDTALVLSAFPTASVVVDYVYLSEVDMALIKLSAE